MSAWPPPPARRVQDVQLLLGGGLELVVVHQRQHPGPLILGLGLAAHAPVGVAQMVVDLRADGSQRNRPLQPLHRGLVVAEAVVGPAQGVGDLAGIRLRQIGLLQHAHSLLQPLAVDHPGIAQVVEHIRLVGLQGQGLEQVLLRVGPAARAVQGRTAFEIQRPVGVGGAGRNQGVEHAHRLAVAIGGAQQVGFGGQGVAVVGLGLDQLLGQLQRGLVVAFGLIAGDDALARLGPDGGGGRDVGVGVAGRAGLAGAGADVAQIDPGPLS